MRKFITKSIILCILPINILFIKNFALSQSDSPVGFVLSGSEHAMIYHKGQWQLDVLFLTYLYPSDSVKVKQEADAEVVLALIGKDTPIKLKYSGRSFFIDHVTTQVHKVQNAKSSSSWQLLFNEITAAFIKKDVISIRRAVSRSGPLTLISPYRTYVLPKEQLKFEWQKGSNESYRIRIQDDETGETLFTKTGLTDTMFVADTSQLKIMPGKHYRWSISDGVFGSDATLFIVATDSTEKLIKEAIRGLGNVSMETESSILRIKLQSLFLINRGFFYDARQLAWQAIQEFPKERELKELLRYCY